LDRDIAWDLLFCGPGLSRDPGDPFASLDLATLGSAHLLS